MKPPPPPPPGLRVRLPAFVCVAQVVVVALYAAFVTYDEHADARFQTNATVAADNALYADYPAFADIQVMIFLGFGCLLAFFRLYGFGGMVFNFLTAAFAIQWAVLAQGYFRFSRGGVIRLGVINLVNAEFACAAVLISCGAVISIQRFHSPMSRRRVLWPDGHLLMSHIKRYNH